MIISNRFLKVVCLFAAVSLTLFIPDTGVWAGTTGKIAGIVIDANTEEPLPGVNVLIEGTSLGAATDLDGLFYIINVLPGEYSVRSVMIGYGAVVQQQVRVNADRTTNLNFSLSQAVLESDEAVVIIADRPLVEQDVASSQSITTSAMADALPVSDIMQAVSLEPGVSVNTLEYNVTVRGGSSAQISFQVDGMERSDKLNDKVYTPTNSATVSEIQVLSGGFSAEYGNIRSGIFNVITKEGGQNITGSVDYRLGPAQKKHFGPDAYGTDQYDAKTFTGPNSFGAVEDIEGNPVFIGWNALADTKNGESWMGKNDWTPQQLEEVWKWRHRPIEYGDAPDHYLDAGLGGPIPGLQDAGFFAGIKYNRIFPILPSISDDNQIYSIEGKINFKPTQSIKLVLSGLRGKNETSVAGEGWGNQALMNYGYDEVGAALGRNKYYMANYDLLDATTTQFGLKLTHTLNPSTFYEVRYNYFSTETEARRAQERSDAIVKTIGGVGFDEAPLGWVHESGSANNTGLAGLYDYFGGGEVEDNSFVKSHLLNVDLTSQINNQHLIKAGFEFGTDHVLRNYYEAGSIILEADAGNFINFDRKPFHYAGYIQDKIEYGGMIANVGLRIEHYDANGTIYDPGNIYSMLWARGGTEGFAGPEDLPQEDSEAFTYVAPRFSVSHPVLERTKFFFNYGVYYDEPTNADRFGLFSESWAFGNGQGDIRRIGYANLEAPRTAAYEIGFEQSIADEWLIRTYFYSKDNSDQIGNLRVDGLDGSHAIGDFRNYEGVGKGSAGYNTSRNNEWEDIRGIELKVTKRQGRFFTGWLNMNYLVSTKGNFGFQTLDQDPLVAYFQFSAVKQQPQTQPSFLANLNFHTPSDWGTWQGDWHLSIIQSWDKGPKRIYNPTNLPTREVRTIYYWINDYRTSLRLSKSLQVMDNLNVRFYMDIQNLFDFQKLNLGVLNSSQSDRYLTQVVDSENGLDKKIGEYEDEQGNNVFTENWKDRDGNDRAPIAPASDFALFYFPRSFLFGIKVEF